MGPKQMSPVCLPSRLRPLATILQLPWSLTCSPPQLLLAPPLGVRRLGFPPPLIPRLLGAMPLQRLMGLPRPVLLGPLAPHRLLAPHLHLHLLARTLARHRSLAQYMGLSPSTMSLTRLQLALPSLSCLPAPCLLPLPHHLVLCPPHTTLPCSSSIVVNRHPMVTPLKDGVSKPRVLMNLNTQIVESEPTNFKQASKDSRYRQAMLDEYKALINNDTWELVPRSYI